MIGAAIDVGTNTALCLIGCLDEHNRLRVLDDRQLFVRLGEGVDAERIIGKPALERLVTALTLHRQAIEEISADFVVVTGTSAARDACNQAELQETVHRVCGVGMNILPGAEEARLTFAGTLAALSDLPGRCAVADVGGGSTEIIIGDGSTGQIEWAHSLNIGSVRLRERCFSRQPAPQYEQTDARRTIEDAIRQAELPRCPECTFILTAGTATTLGYLMRPDATQEALAELNLSTAQLRQYREQILGLSYEEVLALNPRLMTGRADVFGLGLQIFECVAARLGTEQCRISPWALRHGVLHEALLHRTAGPAAR